MKKVLFILLSISFTFIIGSCELDRADYDEVSNNPITGGYIDVTSRLVGYVVGNQGPYSVTFEVPVAKNVTESVDIYVTYNRSTDGAVSNKKLMKTIDVTGQYMSYTVTFSELINGLLVDGEPLSTSDTDLNIGDFFDLSYVSRLADGNVVSNVVSTKVSVGTRFAGKYRCIDGAYYRLGVLTYTAGDWPSETVIESVDATTYKVNEYFGPFNGNEWYFQIDSEYKISYPATTPSGEAQTGNGQPFITCESNPLDMAIVNCGSSNYVVLDDDQGKDKLYMSFGYFTAGSGPRVFYQVLEKIPE